jgi:hypothetical protein
VALGDKPDATRHTVFVESDGKAFAIGTLEQGRTEQFQVGWRPENVGTNP